MDLYEGIVSRRSVRRFTEQPVEKDIIEDVIKAAMYAPSAHNAREWEFVVVDDKALIEAISETSPYAKFAKSAPVVVVICGNTEKEKVAGFWVQDCSAAMQNMLLAVHSKKMGATWCGIHPIADLEMAIQELLELPGHIIPLGLCVMGYTEHSPRQPDRFEPEKIHYNKY